MYFYYAIHILIKKLFNIVDWYKIVRYKILKSFNPLDLYLIYYIFEYIHAYNRQIITIITTSFKEQI